jgi:hypothetical protein
MEVLVEALPAVAPLVVAGAVATLVVAVQAHDGKFYLSY